MKPSIGTEPHIGTRRRLLDRLERGPIWTMDLRREPERYGANPADGVYELRKRGWDIRILRAWKRDSSERPEDFRDYYLLVRGSKFKTSINRWVGGSPAWTSYIDKPWGLALLDAWDREP